MQLNPRKKDVGGRREEGAKKKEEGAKKKKKNYGKAEKRSWANRKAGRVMDSTGGPIRVRQRRRWTNHIRKRRPQAGPVMCLRAAVCLSVGLSKSCSL